MQSYPFQKPEPLHKGIDAFVYGVTGTWKRRRSLLQGVIEEALRIDAKSAELSDLKDRDLRKRIDDARMRFRRKSLNTGEALHEALAALREAARRTLGLHAFPVQLAGAIALHRGYLAEMATGEGKTLTAALAGVLAGFTKDPCHVVTVNDYLVQRDARWVKPLFDFCGVRVGCVTGEMKPDERRQGYAADVTYATSREILADFLRDRMRMGPLDHPDRRLIRAMLSHDFARQSGLVMRGIHTAIIDEADSVLIDEAVTPLIISTQKENHALKDAVVRGDDVIEGLEPGRDYTVNRRYREIDLTREGKTRLAESAQRLNGIWRGESRREELARQALVAREFFLEGRQYILKDGKIVIVDEFSGRAMPQRNWRQGLHQAIEAKEGIDISSPTETVARMSFQRFFRCFSRLSGMTGTAYEAAGELWHIYGLPVVRIPTNAPCIREVHSEQVFALADEKWDAVVDEIASVHSASRPILVGTRSVEASEHLAGLLKEKGLHFELLNAAHAREEAVIISMAGQPGRITIATNMAGRGTDIKLGPGVAEAGGLHVVATERHESARVDRQLFGRCGRQGDCGSVQPFASAEDELLIKFLHPARVNMLQSRGGAVANRLAASALKDAQTKAQKLAFKQRRNVLRTDTWLDDALSFSGGF